MKNRVIAALLLGGALALSPASAIFAQVPSGGPGALGLRYEIWVELDAAGKMLLGKEENVWTNPTGEAVPDMLLHLYWNAFKNEESAFLREAAVESMFGAGDSPDDGEWGWVDITDIRLADGSDLKPTFQFVTPDGPDHPGDQTVGRILFPAPVLPGESVHLRLEFRSKIPRTVARSGSTGTPFSSPNGSPSRASTRKGRVGTAMPTIRTPSSTPIFADFVVHITVPRGYVVGFSGKQTGSRVDESVGKESLTFRQAASRP